MYLKKSFGFDESVNGFEIASGLREILSRLEKKNALPKTIIYSLNPKDNYVIETLLGCFQQGGVYGKSSLAQSGGSTIRETVWKPI